LLQLWGKHPFSFLKMQLFVYLKMQFYRMNHFNQPLSVLKWVQQSQPALGADLKGFVI